MSIIQAVIGSIASSGSARPTYTLTAAANNVDEGGSLTFTVNTTNVVDGTTLWWTTSNNFDGTSRMDNPTGSLDIYSNTGSFSITISADNTTAQSQQTYSVFLYYGGPGGYGGTYTGASVDNIAVNDTSQTPAPVPPFSLEFVENQGDYLETAGSSDWNLGDTWTIEFWLNANAASATAQGGIWGLLNQVGWSTTNAIVVALSDNKLVYLSRAWNANDDVRYVEPTPGVWTHVAIANDAGTQKVFYNGSEQARVSGNVGSASYTNGSSPLRIGRLGPANGGTLNGKMALVRISNTAKYSTAFIPTTTYGVEADTKLFLGTDTPLVDSMSHSITNNGVALSNDVPATFAPMSLQFVQAQTDYLDVAASNDWNLGTTWTIEFWSKATKVSTGSDLLTVMCQNYGVGGSIDLIYYNGQLSVANGTSISSEPTPGIWTHVALVSDGANLKVYYNGSSVYTGTVYTLNNATDPIRVGARGPDNFQRFDGLLALIRISNTAKYTGTFTPSNNYGVEADTKLFLGEKVPLIDAKGHITTNHGVTTSTGYPPMSYTLTVLANDFNHGYDTNYGSNQIWVLIADYPDIVTVPNGATIVVSGAHSGTYTAGGVTTISGKRLLASGIVGTVYGSDTLTITWTT